jgi:hypothetical protein
MLLLLYAHRPVDYLVALELFVMSDKACCCLLVVRLSTVDSFGET